MTRVLVTGAGGFIGGHLTGRLAADGYDVVATDIKPVRHWWQTHPATEKWGLVDLSSSEATDELVAAADPDWIFHLACPMGGIAHITANLWGCARSAAMTSHVLDAAVRFGVYRLFLSSSACAYSTDLQTDPDVPGLTEDMAWPARPEEGYGLSKLFEEKLCEYASADTSLVTRVARYHNIMGAHGTWTGGKEKAPAAACRKVAEAAFNGTGFVEVWGDGQQTRSFCDVDDCVEGSLRLMLSGRGDPLNIGSSEMVTVNELYDLAETLEFGRSGVLERRYQLDAPQGVRGRSSDNTECRRVLGWEPSTSLRDAMGRLYPWVRAQVENEAGR